MTLTPEQLKAREKAIGGSDMGALMGLSPYKSPVELWKEKKDGRDDWTTTEAMEMGHVLEPIIADLYATKNPDVRVSDPDDITFIHGEYPFLIAHPDRRLRDKAGRRGILEIKTSRYGWDRLPPHYELQMRHYMNVLDYDYAVCAVLFGGSEYREYRIERNKLVDAVMIKHAEAFMEGVASGECPTDPSTLEDVSLLFPTPDKKLTLEVGDDHPMLHLVRQHAVLKAKGEAVNAEMDDVKAKIGQMIGNNYNAKYNGHVIASFPEVAGRKTFDYKGFMKDHPQHDYDPYYNQGKPYRRLTVKEVKNG